MEAIDGRDASGKSDRGSLALKRFVIALRSVGRFRGIGWRLLVSVLLFSSIITLLLTLTQLYVDYRRDIEAVDQRMSEIGNGYRQSLGEALWGMDVRQLQLQVDGILRLPDIRSAELREGTDPTVPALVSAGSHEANPPARREFNIVYTNRGVEQLLGVLVVEATFERIYSRLLDRAAIIAAGQAIKTFLVSFFILIIVHALVTRHLTAMANSLTSDNLRDPHTSFRLDRRSPQPADELDDLVDAFNEREVALHEAERRNRDIQMQLAHANRIATMGQLAASIAHEVNQPLGATLMNAGTARRWLEASPPNWAGAKQSVDRIVVDTRRAAEIVQRIRDLAKKAPSQRENLQINQLVLQVLGLIRSEASNRDVLLRTRMAEDLPGVPGDRVQLQQAILNLMMNAIEAMSEVTEGPRELLISTEIAESTGLLIAVSDSGPGLPQANSGNIFEAFYTTKSTGLGMGLSICRSIVEAHGGRLWATPNEPHGAVFRMLLPIGGSPEELKSSEA